MATSWLDALLKRNSGTQQKTNGAGAGTNAGGGSSGAAAGDQKAGASDGAGGTGGQANAPKETSAGTGSTAAGTKTDGSTANQGFTSLVQSLAEQKARTASGGTYTDPYMAQAKALYEQLMNRGDFRYDMNADPFYRQYADMYAQMGRQAMNDAMGSAAGLTGGYGNSWAQHVGNQAYQQYLTQLNAMAPDFFDRAYQVWLNQGDDLLTRYQLAMERAGSSGSGASTGTTTTGLTDEELLQTLMGTGVSSGIEDVKLTPEFLSTLYDVNGVPLDYNFIKLYNGG